MSPAGQNHPELRTTDLKRKYSKGTPPTPAGKCPEGVALKAASCLSLFPNNQETRRSKEGSPRSEKGRVLSSRSITFHADTSVARVGGCVILRHP